MPRTVLSRSTYYFCCTLVGLSYFVLTIALPVVSYRVSKSPLSVEWQLSSDQIAARALEIERRARKRTPYLASDYGRDGLKIARLWDAATGRLPSEHASYQVIQRLLNRALRDDQAPSVRHAVNLVAARNAITATQGKTILLFLLRLYLWSVPFVSLCLLCRLFQQAKSNEEATAMLYHGWRELVGASLTGPLAFEFYEPRANFTRLISDRAWCFRELCPPSASTYAWSSAKAEFELLRPGRSFIHLLRVIWLTDRSVIIPRPWRRDWRALVYYSWILLFLALIGQLRGHADETIERSAFDLNRVLLTVQKPEGKQLKEDLRLFFHGGTDIHIFGLRSRQPAFELNQNMVRAKARDLGFTGGPFIEFQAGRVTAFGEEGFVSFKPHPRVRLTAPQYLLFAPSHDYRFFIPDGRLHYLAGQDWSIGIGFTPTISFRRPDSLLAGPSVSISPSKRATLHLRFAQWLKHPKLKGKRQLRLDFAYSF